MVELVLNVVLVLTSIILIVLILLHRGKGGGLSSMFGGAVSSSLAGSSVVEKNLNRLTVICAVIWASVAALAPRPTTSAASPASAGGSIIAHAIIRPALHRVISTSQPIA